MKKIGIYGGSFDPIHLGHLILAEAAREDLHLDQVIFVPALQSPLKGHLPVVSGADRLALLQLAIKDNPFFTCSDLELKREPPSYTIDTLSHFRQEFPQDGLYFLLGQDSLNTLSNWHRFREIFGLATLAVAKRPGFSLRLPPTLKEFRNPSAQSHGIVFFDNPQVELSSRTIRERIRLGKSVRYWLEPLVLNYILENKLYT